MSDQIRCAKCNRETEPDFVFNSYCVPCLETFSLEGEESQRAPDGLVPEYVRAWSCF